MATNDPSAVTRSRLRYVWNTLLVLLIVVGGWMVYCGVSTSLRAERNVHATLLTIRLVEQFVHDKGRWPCSRQELEQQPFPSSTPSPSNVGGQYPEDWPAASKHLQECVAVDFQADPELIAQQDPMAFDAIKPIGPYYEYRHYGLVASLQSTLKDRTPQVPKGSRQGTKQEGEIGGNSQRLTPYSQVPEDIDRDMMLDAKMHELEMPHVYQKGDLIQVPPQAPPLLEERRHDPSP